jgi:hypothetical protein
MTTTLDMPAIADLTPRAVACIQLRVPKSGDAELDNLIREAVRRELAGRAPPPPEDFGWTAGEHSEGQRMTRWASQYADALLAALEASQ